MGTHSGHDEPSTAREGWAVTVIVVGILLSLLLCTSCTGTAGIMRAMAKDPATVAANIGSVYGTVRFVRIGTVPAGTTVHADPTGAVTVTGPAIPSPAPVAPARAPAKGK